MIRVNNQISYFLLPKCHKQSLSFAFGIGKSTIAKVLAETCQKIHDSLKGTALQALTTPK